jgi:3-methyladenine DNA glycosylase AlkD
VSVLSKEILNRLCSIGNKKIAEQSQRYFKTGRGEYGEGDRFLGIRVPTLRKYAKEYYTIPLEDILELLRSPLHEARLLALLILVRKYSLAGSKKEKKVVYHAYFQNTRYINNWDLVDSSAEHIVGAYLYARNRKPVYRLVRSANLWERRIGVMSTFHFVKRGDFSDTLAVASLLLNDREDLIHKAVGWMLREVGHRDRDLEELFLRRHYRQMPRTMLRYAIEKSPEDVRLAYLRGLS